MATLKEKINEMDKKVKEAEERRNKEVETARKAAEKEIEDYKKLVKEELQNDREKQKKAAQQQTLIDESGKIIDYLRKENTKLRSQNDAMRKDFKSLKDNNARLMEANSSASQSFTSLNDRAKDLNQTNAQLIKNVETNKKTLEKLKDDLKTRQSYYLAEAESRLSYQNTMAQIVNSIQDKCRNPQLIEDVVIMALECEASGKSERAALDKDIAAGKKKVEGKKSKSSKKKNDNDDDSEDSD